MYVILFFFYFKLPKINLLLVAYSSKNYRASDSTLNIILLCYKKNYV